MTAKIPTVFILFGVTGDLAQKKIFPALLDLYNKKMLPEKFQIVGVARRELSIDDFRKYVRELLEKKKKYRHEDIEKFVGCIEYLQGQFDDATTYKKLSEYLESVDQKFGICSNKLFYLAVPPTLYELILTNISVSGLTIPCSDSDGWTRVLVEKPFGNDTKTARKLDRLLGSLFKEEQIYRIDHYLAKQTLQNILTFRFSNTLFEPLWNRKHIRSVVINLFENNRVGDRGAFYDPIGALRDVGQNHMLQMLALVAMEQPKTLLAEDIRKERAKVLSKLKIFSGTAVRGQYDGYLEEKGVAPNSETETYFSIEAEINNSRWRGVPFTLRSGKALGNSKVEIIVNFKDETPGRSFLPEQFSVQEQNRVTFHIQPDEKISVLFWVLVPGFENKIASKELTFDYEDFSAPGGKIDAYEKVLYECVIGDQTSFASTKEVAASWKYIMSVLDGWQKIPLQKYAPGSGGPAA